MYVCTYVCMYVCMYVIHTHMQQDDTKESIGMHSRKFICKNLSFEQFIYHVSNTPESWRKLSSKSAQKCGELCFIGRSVNVYFVSKFLIQLAVYVFCYTS
jgi:hypothetical protein